MHQKLGDGASWQLVGHIGLAAQASSSCLSSRVSVCSTRHGQALSEQAWEERTASKSSDSNVHNYLDTRRTNPLHFLSRTHPQLGFALGEDLTEAARDVVFDLVSLRTSLPKRAPLSGSHTAQSCQKPEPMFDKHTSARSLSKCTSAWWSPGSQFFRRIAQHLSDQIRSGPTRALTSHQLVKVSCCRFSANAATAAATAPAADYLHERSLADRLCNKAGKRKDGQRRAKSSLITILACAVLMSCSAWNAHLRFAVGWERGRLRGKTRQDAEMCGRVGAIMRSLSSCYLVFKAELAKRIRHSFKVVHLFLNSRLYLHLFYMKCAGGHPLGHLLANDPQMPHFVSICTLAGPPWASC